jgi:hypothetical protein
MLLSVTYADAAKGQSLKYETTSPQNYRPVVHDFAHLVIQRAILTKFYKLFLPGHMTLKPAENVIICKLKIHRSPETPALTPN